MRRILTLLLLSLALGSTARAETLQVVPRVDLERFVGTWYEIARLPNWFQKKCAGNTTATYSLNEDGTIRVVNRCAQQNGELSEAVGVAKVANTDGPNTKLKVRFAPGFLSFLPFVWGDYWIIELADDYGYVVIGEPSRKYFWVLARAPQLEQATLDRLLESARAQGYRLDDLLMTPQE